jgi:hypothetical protein
LIFQDRFDILLEIRLSGVAEQKCTRLYGKSQIKEFIMCDEKNKCQQPEKLEEKPEECSPEQVEECHGDVKEHPCTEETEQKEQ